MWMPQWRRRLLNRCLARRSPPKLPSMPAGKTRRKHNRGHSRWTRLFRHRLIHCGNALVVGNWTATVWDCPSPHDGILATFVRTALALPTRYCSSIQPKQDNKPLCDEYWPLAQPATSTWCQGGALFARDEAKRLLPIRCTRRGERRRTNGSEGHQMEPFTWLPAELYFHPLLNSIGAYQRYKYRLRAVCDAQRQKLPLSGDIEQHPGPIAVIQMNVSCLTPSKIATLMAQGADIIAIQETWKSSEQIASMHT
ncbi:hypothetical protein C3747_5g745 [Trypanosoma cruzi]|uniref:Uncharacterized protein n=1 Tax=Trypanosoma cruzi TaxID=5693 RepID=A0A2V2XIS1_TRYCR|nr:hypothetical protein C3747_5g745 [Trypanosoma cruzi]